MTSGGAGGGEVAVTTDAFFAAEDFNIVSEDEGVDE